MKIIVCPSLLKYFTRNFASAIAFYPFIFIKNEELKSNNTLIQHELIHFRQQIELGIILFYLWYLIEYLIKLIIYRNHYKAYRNISFEKEAYCYEENLNYLKSRSFWSFLKFLK